MKHSRNDNFIAISVEVLQLALINLPKYAEQILQDFWGTVRLPMFTSIEPEMQRDSQTLIPVM